MLTLWDTLLTDPTRSNILVCSSQMLCTASHQCSEQVSVCTAMLSLVRDSLLTNDFASNMKMLQNYPELDMRLILEKARQLGSPS